MSALPWTGPLSYSLLKLISSSPAEFLYACGRGGIDVTDPMRLGTCAHWHLLGGHPDRMPLVYRESKTRGEGAVKRWRDFQDANAGKEIFSGEQWDEGSAIASAVRDAPHNRARYERWIEGGTFELPLRWTRGGLEFATRGVDVLHDPSGLHPGGEIVDVKTARSVESYALQRQAQRLHYAEQVAIYRGAARANGYRVDGVGAVLAVCSSPPYLTRVLRYSSDALDAADARVDGWIATLRRCLDAGHWPGGGEEDAQEAWTTTGEDELESETV